MSRHLIPFAWLDAATSAAVAAGRDFDREPLTPKEHDEPLHVYRAGYSAEQGARRITGSRLITMPTAPWGDPDERLGGAA